MSLYLFCHLFKHPNTLEREDGVDVVYAAEPVRGGGGAPGLGRR